ncbi:MAG: Beta-lactamase enzyme family protein [Anaerosporomusa subterranea]|nr:Beta-lactamase enzyme family protein [Anaerosporomusa subterranea]
MKPKLVLLLVVVTLISACTLQNAPQKKPTENSAPPTQASDETDRQISRIRRNAEAFNGKAGLFAKNLKTGKTIAINEHQIFPTASTHKLVVALATYKYLYLEVSPDKKKQYDLYIKNMMQVSDNPAFYRMVRELDSRKPEALSQVLKDLQLKNTWIHSEEAFRKYGYHSVTTPAEMATIFETIYHEQYLGKEMSAIVKEELAKTIFHEEIPRFMQKSKVMHKVGSLPGMLCDVGIVDDGKDQILISIFTTSKQAEKQSSLYIAEASADLYNALRSR